MYRADCWLFEQVEMLREWRGVEEMTARAVAGVDALEAAGVLDGDAAAEWRARMTVPQTDRRIPVVPDPAADALLGELLATDDDDRDGAGGSAGELVAVLPGPESAQADCRVIVSMRFTDGVSFVIERERGENDFEQDNWPFWRLTDEAEGTYRMAGGSSGRLEYVSFRGAPPPGAARLELTAAGGGPSATFRIVL